MKIFLSTLQVIVDNAENEYKLDSPIVHHFCFLEAGRAVAMRNGDILLFNPTKYHCMSKKEKIVDNNDVYVNSFYL